jgi:hypothetical protein
LPHGGPLGRCCLSCDCPEDEFDSGTRRPGVPRLVEDIIWKIEEASAEYLEEDGIIKNGKIGKVAEWELENRIKLHWNIWFHVSCRALNVDGIVC